ncbi:MAG TPA: hypothetical protein VJU59_17545, partial [Paraburkholderia sp.]|uniref:hypothetical protein n=1 Tax=Paraburkholderia sp. TaxID=1926495 RepID=UPI002B4894AB
WGCEAPAKLIFREHTISSDAMSSNNLLLIASPLEAVSPEGGHGGSRLLDEKTSQQAPRSEPPGRAAID